MKPIFLTTVLLSFVISQEAFAKEFKCEFQSKFHCDGNSCIPIEPTTWNLVDLETKSIARCDNQGCDWYEMEIHQSGFFTIFDVAERGFMAKMSIDGKSYIEIATLGTEAYVSQGSCELRR